MIEGILRLLGWLMTRTGKVSEAALSVSRAAMVGERWFVVLSLPRGLERPAALTEEPPRALRSALVRELAACFADEMLRLLGSAGLQQVVSMNRSYGAQYCASLEVLDAKQVMSNVFMCLLGRRPAKLGRESTQSGVGGQSAADLDRQLTEEAWSLARRMEFAGDRIRAMPWQDIQTA